MDEERREVKDSIRAMLEDISFEEKKEVKNAIHSMLNDIMSNEKHGVRETIRMMMKDISSEEKKEAKNSIHSMLNDIMSDEKHGVKETIRTMFEDISSEEKQKAKKFVHSMKDDDFFSKNREIDDYRHTDYMHTSLDNLPPPKSSRNGVGSADSAFNSTYSSHVGDYSDIYRARTDVPRSDKKDNDTSRRTNADFDHKNKVRDSELAKKIVAERVEAIESQDEIIKKLLNNSYESNSVTPDMYADTWNKPTYFASPDDENVPIDFLKQRINEKLKTSLNSSVISTVSNEVDMTAVLALEKAFGKAFSEKFNTRLGFTPFFILASIAALKKHKIFNAHIRGDEIIYKNHYDISVITCGNDGVMAPVIRHADLLSVSDIEKAMITLSKRAIEGTLSVEEVSGGTFTVVNAGVYGSLMGTDLLTVPQVATLSVHRMSNRPVATDNGVEIRPMLYISLSYDHRVSDTKQASEFLVTVKNYVENPGWTTLGL
jgi:2-oxoglutarate dehydrogenase E2 component (dihydrolipoamide succinyltransferase)